ncbi:MAG: YhcH/YjgK/YiaL family protein [Nitrospiraceae bacterium]|nr:YhcH/YjgK/YiaL family protein [Nitrospiraceae bacterium]
MIVTDLEHMEKQLPATPSFRKAMAFLRRKDLNTLADGRVEIDGDRVFALPQRYETLAPGAPKLEYHRKYIDIQFIVSGDETMGWATVDRMQISEPYDEKKDAAFGFADEGILTLTRLVAGQLAVFFPEDGHAPRLSTHRPSPVYKIVIKVAVS